MQFDSPDLLSDLTAASPDDLDQLSFGVILMKTDGVVIGYNAQESQLSGLAKESVVGRHFFSQVAPCTNNFMVSHRFEAEAELDATIDYVFTLKMRPTPVKLRLLKSSASNHMALLVQTASMMRSSPT